MGNFLSSVSAELEGLLANSSNCWIDTFAQVREYHGYFKYVCDSFIITHEESKEIFGNMDKAKVWDPQNIGKIDALEIFCGLVIFSQEATFKKKLSFLFNMFDFNEIKSLSFIDVEVMILSICNSVYKVIGKNARTSESEIGQWLNDYLPQKQRIKITTLYYFCVNNTEVNTFFKLINLHYEELVPATEEKQEENDLCFQKYLVTDTSNTMNECLEWHKNLLSKMKRPNTLSSSSVQEQFGCKISWIYGINTAGRNAPFLVLNQKQILYRVSSFAVFYNLQTNTQYLLQGHQAQVDCFAYSYNNDILATVQKKPFPPVNLWVRDRKSNEFILWKKINNNHQDGVKILQFILRQKYLATVDKRIDSPIIIFNYIEGVVVHHILLKDQILQIFDPLILFDVNLVPVNIYNTFYARSLSKQIIYQVQLSESKHHTVHPYSYSSELVDPITCVCACYLNLSNTSLRSYMDKSAGIAIITGHESGSIRMLSSNPNYNEEELVASSFDKRSVSCIKINEETLAFSMEEIVYLYEIDLIDSKVEPLVIINLTQYESQLHLLSYNIVYFDFIGDYLIAMTKNGEFVTMSPQQVYKPEDNFNQYLLQVKSIDRLIKFQGKNCIFCILSWKKDRELILFVSKNNKILGIDSVTHEVHDIWEISTVEAITNIDAVCSQQGNCYVVCGSNKGKLYIRIDWEESPKYYDCVSEIVDLKLSKDCSYLLVATSASSLLFFTQTNKNFTSPRKLLFQNQIPMSIAFLDNFRYFLVITSAVNIYQIEIPQLKHHLLEKETETISISQMNIKYPFMQASSKQHMWLRSCLGATMKFSLISSISGSLHFFNSAQALLRGSFSTLTAHQGPLSMLVINNTNQKFYSLGSCDNTLIQWEIFQCKQARDGTGQKLALPLNRHTNSIRLTHQELKINKQFQSMQYFVTNELIEQSNYFFVPDQQQSHGLSNSSYFFKSTRNERLNEALEIFGAKQWNNINGLLPKKGNTTAVDIDCYFRRPPDISLRVASVYGLDSHHRNCVCFDYSGQHTLMAVSRFILKINLKTKEQTIFQPTNRRITFMACHTDGNIFYSVAGCSEIFVLFRKILTTEHRKGVLHFKLYKELIISFGVSANQYSINMHNHITGELLHHSCTKDKISEFIMVSRNLVVSLPQLRVWKDFYPSPCYGIVTAGCLLPHRSDVLFAVGEGELAILDAKKSFWQPLGIRAHEKPIDHIITKSDNSNSSDSSFEIITIGQDEKLKIWSDTFQCRIMINFRERGNIIFLSEENKKTEISCTLSVKAVDLIDNRLLLVMHTGQIAHLDFKWNKQMKRTLGNQHQDTNLLNFESMSKKSLDDAEISSYSEKSIAEMTYNWSNILAFHSSREKNNFNRRFFFSVNQVFPLLATSASDNQIIITNHETNVEVCQCFFDGVTIDYVKFLPNGRLIALGFGNGDVKFYEVKIYRNQEEEITSVSLKFFQTFSPKGTFDAKTAQNTSKTQNQETFKTLIVSIQFSQCGTYFVVSYISRNEQLSKSFIQIFKTRQPASVEHGMMDQQQSSQVQTQNQYYFLCDTLIISEEAKTNSQKYMRSVYFMSFLQDNLKMSLMFATIKSHRQMKSTNSLAYQDKGEKGSLHLVFYEQFVTQNLMRVNGDNKVKIKAYNLEERAFAKEEYCFNLLKWKFPHFVNGKQKSNAQSQSLNPKAFQKCMKPFFNQTQEKRLNDKFQEQQIQAQVVISDMIFLGNEAIIYGDETGKIHAVKFGNLFHNEDTMNNSGQKSRRESQSKNINEVQISDMSLAKTYVSHTSFINQMEMSHDQQYLFVSGAVDDCVVKYRVSVEGEWSDLDSICYPVQAEDPHEQYLNRSKFLDFLNNLEPIREQISEIMMDVETSDFKQKVGLELFKVFGRRSFDRRNNLYHDGLNNLVYTLGPNIILQDQENPLKQQVINVDPDPFSNSPQISCTSFLNSCFIATTEQEFSRVFVWDIYSLTCLNQFKLKNFSIIYHISQSSTQKVFLVYGVNSSFQPLVQLVNWETGMVLGNYSLMHSGCWKIKDMCEFVNRGDGFEFVTCGVQHLACWEYKAGVLVCSSFQMGSRLNETTFLAVRTVGSTVITGCQSGVLYLWSNFQLVNDLALHATAIRSIQVKDNLIFSAGMDSKVYLTQLIHQDTEISLRAEEQFQIDPSNNFQKKELQLAQKDIQALAITNNLQKIYAGTRSGSIYCVERRQKQRETEAQEKQFKEEVQNLQCILSAHDNDTVAHMAFDLLNPNIFYMLTVSGIIEIWSLSNLLRIGHFQMSQQACKLFCLQGRILVTCDRKIFVVNPNIQQQKLEFHNGLSRQFEGTITDCVMSKKNQNGKYFFAVGIRKSQFNEIVIHEIGEEIVQKFVVVNLKYEIEFLDFSRDCRYLLFKDSFEELGMVNLLTFKRINTIFVDMGVQWESQGLRISPHGQRIYCSYSRDNKITNVKRLGSSHIIVGDQMGTLRIFEYPCPEQKLGELHTGCYSSHMNYIKNIVIHPTLPYVLSNSVYDRSIILWKVTGPIHLQPKPQKKISITED